MAMAFRCDNCNSYYSTQANKKSLTAKLCDANNVAFSFVDLHGQKLLKHFDICPECMGKVQNVLFGVCEKERQNENAI